jgi:hypothetical protein
MNMSIVKRRDPRIEREAKGFGANTRWGDGIKNKRMERREGKVWREN